MCRYSLLTVGDKRYHFSVYFKLDQKFQLIFQKSNHINLHQNCTDIAPTQISIKAQWRCHNCVSRHGCWWCYQTLHNPLYPEGNFYWTSNQRNRLTNTKFFTQKYPNFWPYFNDDCEVIKMKFFQCCSYLTNFVGLEINYATLQIGCHFALISQAISPDNSLTTENQYADKKLWQRLTTLSNCKHTFVKFDFHFLTSLPPRSSGFSAN